MLAASNARALEREVAWFVEFLDQRFRIFFEPSGDEVCNEFSYPVPPSLDDDESSYASLVKEFDMNLTERIVLMLALMPQIRPQVLDVFQIRNEALDSVYVEFGGISASQQIGFLPTLVTAAFICGGRELESRFEIAEFLSPDHFFNSHGILDVDLAEVTGTLLDARLATTPETLERLTSSDSYILQQQGGFPARLITTRLDWHDLVLAPEVIEEINDLIVWSKSSSLILKGWGLKESHKPGYRTLFHGLPGTGKTLTATLIGAAVEADVYRIDLSVMGSKYIGETEKNLAKVFDRTKEQNWILFFDEAEALFVRRTQATSSNDRNANQEVSYLLQRVEDYLGLVILATNLPANIDEVFARRFQSIIHFPMPGPTLRLKLWSGIVDEKCPLDADVDLEELAQQYELSGGAIFNVVRYGAMKAMQGNLPGVLRADLIEGIRRELGKSG